MKTIALEVERDHLERLTRVRRPSAALAELVWNAFDADATKVQISFISTLGGLAEVHVSDNGLGMRPEDAEAGFKSLGGSWKRKARQSRSLSRRLHGKAGKGRLKAFALGSVVEWRTRYQDNDQTLACTLRGSSDDLRTFELSDSTPTGEQTGTDVVILEVHESVGRLESTKGRTELTEDFALYTKLYPDIQLVYAGIRIRPEEAQDRTHKIPLQGIDLPGGRRVAAHVEIIEWLIPVERGLFLCDDAGFALDRDSADVHAPGFQYTAYLCSKWIRELYDTQLLELGDFRPPELKDLVAQARTAIRGYFRSRQAENAAQLVEDWKKEDAYPYRDDPKTPLDQAKRDVFDIVAISVANHLPDLNAGDVKSRRFSLRLLKEALEESPESVQKIVGEVLETSGE